MSLCSYYWRPASKATPAAVIARLASVLASWDRTPYHSGWQAKRMGVDCIRFVCAVLDEMRGCSPVPIHTLPQDAAMHTREGAMRVMRQIRRLYMPNFPVKDGSLEPGDVIVTGPSDGGPGHAMIVGPEENTLWHSTGRRVQQTGLGYIGITHSKLFRVYRSEGRPLWLG